MKTYNFVFVILPGAADQLDDLVAQFLANIYGENILGQWLLKL